MYQIIEKKQLSDRVFKLIISAPLIAKARKAGHFVIVRVGEGGERVPYTIAQADPQAGTITLVVQEVGLSSTKLCQLEAGDYITDVVGPLGRPTDIRQYGTVVCAGGGVGVAPMLPIIQALKAAGNTVVSVLAARSRELIILEDEVRASSDEVIIMTDDGSYGQKGLVTAGVESVIRSRQVDKCFAIGPAVMMKFVCELTRQYHIPTDVSLNTIMVDGTGMCGACRISVDGQTRFVCVDGPEFDGHKVDFDEMIRRQKAFRPTEVKEMRKLDDDATADTSRNAPWRVALRKRKTPKERMQLERCSMPQLPPHYRVKSLYEEVNQGLSEEQAVTEASRCLDCANPGCVSGCPVGIDIPRFVKHIEAHEFLQAAQTLAETSCMPAVCGRVCPQEKQCESQCIHLKTGHQAVAIGYLERFAADFERLHAPHETECKAEKAKADRIRIAVVGSGPAGISFAGEMCRLGYDVTVFEALHEIGGVLKYGIPEFRLPNQIVDYEIQKLIDRGVTFNTDCIIGKTISLQSLRDMGFKGIFIASGAGLPRFMNIPGENAINIMSSNEYLTRVNLMHAAESESDTPIVFGKRVVVVGGGNTAMDAVRTALRLGAESATIVYRRSEAEMPARIEEVQHAKEEGVRFLTLHNPLRYEADDDGCVCRVVLQKMQLGEPDESGRRRPVPIEGAIEKLETDLVIVSIGVSPNPIIPNSEQKLITGRRGTIEVDEHMATSMPLVYAGGDIVRGGATVILAMGDGRRAARSMHAQMQQR